MPCPYVLTFGVAYRPIDRLTLALTPNSPDGKHTITSTSPLITCPTSTSI